ncbi:hypothetical protein [Cohnella hongkongensis]|uniref:HTH luxR-type domain-containing protein n=1 Tax=Cohnella hongkongensis TaxID=178337 RepID=A0ABV9F859_9BACL
MATMMADWEIVIADDSRSARMCEAFGERYGLTEEEAAALKLCLLYGLSDEEIAGHLKIEPTVLANRFACMLGKTRARSLRELQALFFRFLMNRLLV